MMVEYLKMNENTYDKLASISIRNHRIIIRKSKVLLRVVGLLIITKGEIVNFFANIGHFW